jgi:hypothetical protein
MERLTCLSGGWKSRSSDGNWTGLGNTRSRGAKRWRGFAEVRRQLVRDRTGCEEKWRERNNVRLSRGQESTGTDEDRNGGGRVWSSHDQPWIRRAQECPGRIGERMRRYDRRMAGVSRWKNRDHEWMS